MDSFSNFLRRQCALVLVALCVLIMPASVLAQVENVPVYHPVYSFLKRMELKGIVSRYHDAILPLSRGDVAKFLVAINEHQQEMSGAERDALNEYRQEFQFDITGSTDGYFSGLDFSDHTFGDAVAGIFNDKEKFLYAFHDSTVSFFADGLLTVDARKSAGDALDDEHAEFVQFGGRFRGTAYGRLGYYLQGTNAQFWGSRNVLERDKFIGQAYTLAVSDAQNFDFSDGYLRYQHGILSMQLGQERLLWGNGYGDKLILSDNTRDFPFIRMDAQYKAVKYTFMHGWLLGNRSNLTIQLPGDTTHYTEPVNDDKYIAAHRIGVSLGESTELAFQEMVIYSNRSVDLAYLNPLMVLESAQRARGERDNVFWAFDAKCHPMANLELQGTILFDDLNFSRWGTNDVQNKDALQLGVMMTDPLGMANTSAAFEYTRVEPYTFSHNRSRDDSYSSNGLPLSHHIGPNSQSWYAALENLWTYRFHTLLSYEYIQHGANIIGPNGIVAVNVGGDIFQPHRPGDPEFKDFLGGNYLRTHRISLAGTCEIYRRLYLEAHYALEHVRSVTYSTTQENRDFGIDVRLEY